MDTDSTILSKLIVVGGPTASGKTSLAIEIAKEFNGEIINADSRQIYKYLDIGTNKGDVAPTNHNEKIVLAQDSIPNPFTPKPVSFEVPVYHLEDVPIHLISFLEPDERFNVFRFKKFAEKIVQSILSRNKLPILVGGTGLYIDAIVKNYQQDELSEFYDANYRSYLNSLDINILQAMIQKINPAVFDTLNDSDKQNPRRLSRLLEKLKALEIKGDVQSVESIQSSSSASKKPVFDVTFFYPEHSWDVLKQRIDQRAEEMFDQGLIDETEVVLEMGYPKDAPAFSGVGYPEVISYLDGDLSLDECKEKVKIAHKQYARKQRTWFEGGSRGYELIKVQNFEDIKEYL